MGRMLDVGEYACALNADTNLWTFIYIQTCLIPVYYSYLNPLVCSVKEEAFECGPFYTARTSVNYLSNNDIYGSLIHPSRTDMFVNNYKYVLGKSITKKIK